MVEVFYPFFFDMHVLPPYSKHAKMDSKTKKHFNHELKAHLSNHLTILHNLMNIEIKLIGILYYLDPLYPQT